MTISTKIIIDDDEHFEIEPESVCNDRKILVTHWTVGGRHTIELPTDPDFISAFVEAVQDTARRIEA